MNNDRKFLKGFIFGLAGSLLITTVVLIVIVTLGLGSSAKQDDTASVDSYAEIEKKVEKIKNFIGKYYLEEVDEEDYKLGIYKGLVASLSDPYSVYYTEKEYQDMLTSSSGMYYGIGVSVSQNTTTGIITVVKPFVTGPGYEAGILPEDIIYKVEDEEVTGLDLSDVVSKIKGPEGTTVNISIIRENESDVIEFTIERRKIEVPTIEYEMLDNNIGYIQITEFDEVTLDQFIDAVDDLESKNQKGLIIDVRDNPGGLLNIVVDMLDYMLPNGMIVYTEDKYGNREEFKSNNKHEFTKPLAILINGNSASASEIFAGAVKDYGIGTLVGKTTFGKGIVQRLFTLGDGTALKLTISKYYTPNGNDIHEIGIEPDVEVDLDSELKKQVVIEKDDDNQLQKAMEVLLGEIGN